MTKAPSGGLEPATGQNGKAAAGEQSPAAVRTEITASRGLARWLLAHSTSFAFSSYQSGQLFVVGVLPDGTISFNQQNFNRAMGLCWRPNRLYLASLFQIWRLENILDPGQLANGRFDAALLPRNAQTTGDVDAHELSVDAQGRVVFVNTSYSCLATLDRRHSFRPIWKPSFVSALVPEDRCHLNGLAMAEGKPKYVTAVSRSDVLQGWRQRRADGGVLIDVEQDRIVAEGLSMPHSPRIGTDGIYALDSGRGYLIRIDPESGSKTDIIFCPGFLRGLTLVGGFALVTISKPREKTFDGLQLDAELRKRDADAWCGVLVINLSTGAIVEWLKLDGSITELFDVAAMPNVRCPMSVGPSTPDAQSTITFKDEIEPA